MASCELAARKLGGFRERLGLGGTVRRPRWRPHGQGFFAPPLLAVRLAVTDERLPIQLPQFQPEPLPRQPRLKLKPLPPPDTALLINALSNVPRLTDTDKTSAVINALVSHLSYKWRSNFARQVATKFNCFFLLSFMEEFNEYLRLELDKVYSGTSTLITAGNSVGSLFDLREMSSKLEEAERELERELDKAMFKKKMLTDIIESGK